LPPKFSFALKDLAEFLGIFEITEEQIKRKRQEMSETSSNMSYMTQSAFKPRREHLDVINEKADQRSDDSEEDVQESGATIG